MAKEVAAMLGRGEVLQRAVPAFYAESFAFTVRFEANKLENYTQRFKEE
ncbi:hypothetical protein LF1_35760 [Rubripirellula obstinata]|uniref:Uncharacterized protein n=1 Tax=Rubripirellula obstinata TaxID=406547 RepID=A0A5B1CNT9_9BACT|nr:hypothetical protein LF1_35760 [Rubripirellula obstinata]